jgi:hypothetical protein
MASRTRDERSYAVDNRTWPRCALKVVQSLRTEIAATPPEYAQAALDLAGFIAARNRDAELADTVAIVSIERLVATKNVDRLLPTASVIVEWAAAVADRKEALATLARRLENLAFVAPAESFLKGFIRCHIVVSCVGNPNSLRLPGRSFLTQKAEVP